MPRRDDINKIMMLGAGPIVIGQACEFDYSGAQACKALKEENYEVVLVNSNPATIMTDPAMADSTYVEPVEWNTVARIIEQEKPDALLPTMGGQTALNCALDLEKHGTLKQHNVQLIGASSAAIRKAEDRDLFDQAMQNIGLQTPRASTAHSMDEAMQVQRQLGFPCVIRPSFTLGGSGGGIAYNMEEFQEICQRGFELSPNHELLIDESLIGWKEFEMEVVRDHQDNCIIICSIENLDPMGVHTGDSITVAPAQTLTDKELQIMRNAAMAVLREIGVETGGSNVQFAVNPEDGRMLVIEMNPRVSRSSALASKATGFPIARVAAKLAVGYTLAELHNDITVVTPASFEPSIDYVVTKLPRFAFEKFPQASNQLTTQMKSVGEVMAIGRTFQESLQKALRGLEVGCCGLDEHFPAPDHQAHCREALIHHISTPSAERIWFIGDAFRAGLTPQEIHTHTHIDLWFLAQIKELIDAEQEVAGQDLHSLDAPEMLRLKRMGFSDARLARLLRVEEAQLRQQRLHLGVRPVYLRVDTCAAEFPVKTAYLYSTYEQECEALPGKPGKRRKIMVLGGGPNRIGQGIEFDYCCVHAVQALREKGKHGKGGCETIMVNCNPETVSTDYDVSDRLYFEPVTLEDVLSIVDLEQPQGVIVQFGGQTPLKLVHDLQSAGVQVLGTRPDAIDRAEDRQRFQELITHLGLKQPENASACSYEQGLQEAHRVGYPMVVRPSYVLGGQAMEIVYSQEELKQYLQKHLSSRKSAPILLDRFLDQAVEVDVDAVCDNKQVLLGGIMEHIEQAGVHSGDSACVLPPHQLSEPVQQRIGEQVRQIALELGVVGLMNVQFAVQGEDIYILEVNPRASRTIPFVSKGTGISLAKVAAQCMAGVSLRAQGFRGDAARERTYVYVKEAVFPFNKFPGVDPILGPEMKSTGEVMGVGKSFPEAFAKAMLAAGIQPPQQGCAFLSVKDSDKPQVTRVAKVLRELGFTLSATRGTCQVLAAANIPVQPINKVGEGRPDIADKVKNRELALIINTTEGRQSIRDSATIRQLALQYQVCHSTTLAGGEAICHAIRHGAIGHGDSRQMQVRRLQDMHDLLAR